MNVVFLLEPPFTLNSQEFFDLQTDFMLLISQGPEYVFNSYEDKDNKLR